MHLFGLARVLFLSQQTIPNQISEKKETTQFWNINPPRGGGDSAYERGGDARRLA